MRPKKINLIIIVSVLFVVLAAIATYLNIFAKPEPTVEKTPVTQSDVVNSTAQ